MADFKAAWVFATSDTLPVSGETRDVTAQHRPSGADEFRAQMHIHRQRNRQHGASCHICYFEEQVCSGFRGGFFPHLFTSSVVSFDIAGIEGQPDAIFSGSLL
jgi:hypothetical protein